MICSKMELWQGHSLKNLLILRQKKDILLLQTVAYAVVFYWKNCQRTVCQKWRCLFRSMINKVDGNNYYVYTNQKKIDVLDTGEKFNLDYKNNESSLEAKDKKELSEKQQQAERRGVMLELSSRERDAKADRQGQTETAKTQSESNSGQVPLLETIRTYVMAAIAAVREFFYNIWNERPQEGVSQDVPLLEEGILQEPEESIDALDEMSALAEGEEGREREIQESLRIGDMDQVINLLTDNGKRTIAKNSTLLTSYDKNGRVVEPNTSDMERVLHGDRNTWEL